MVKQIGLGILGGTGYGAGELLRLIPHHPDVDVVSVVSSSQAERHIDDAHPHLRGVYSEMTFDSALPFDKFQKYKSFVVVSALPHGVTTETMLDLLPQIEDAGGALIDLSADFRLGDPKIREAFYPETKAAGHLQEKFVYGLPELFREHIPGSTLLSNPGCLATASILSVAPLVDETFSGEIVFDAKTGTSGAGRTIHENFHHPKRTSNMAAYKMLSHRHEPEILQALGDVRGERIKSYFVPHLLPSSRGIFVTSYLRLKKAASREELYQRYREFYKDSPFVRLVPDSPDLQAVLGSNFCDIALAVRGSQVVVMTALDNLVKGMVGQAIQNMNLMLRLPETTGLWFPGLGPI